MENVSDEQIRQILGLHPSHGYQEAEIEHPDLIATVIPSNEHRSLPLYLNNRAIEKISKGNWYGKANRLSEDHVAWDVIDAVAEASIKPEVENKSCKLMKTCSGIDWGKVTETIKFQRITARQIVLKRRSAVAFDGMTSISDQEFYGMLSHLLAEPRHSVMPWDAVQWSSSIHLLLFLPMRKKHRIPSRWHRCYPSLPGNFQNSGISFNQGCKQTTFWEH